MGVSFFFFLVFFFFFQKERYAAELICPILAAGTAAARWRGCHGDWAQLAQPLASLTLFPGPPLLLVISSFYFVIP